MVQAVTVAVEGDVEVAVLRRIFRWLKMSMGPVHGLRGKGWLDRHLNGYNHAARFAPWCVLRDLDRDADCAPPLRNRLLPQPAERMCFRIVVREVESWLLADRERISRFLAIEPAWVTPTPEDLEDPKQTVVNLSRRSRQRAVRTDMVPAPGTTSAVGPGYTARLIEFSLRQSSVTTASPARSRP